MIETSIVIYSLFVCKPVICLPSIYLYFLFYFCLFVPFLAIDLFIGVFFACPPRRVCIVSVYVNFFILCYFVFVELYTTSSVVAIITGWFSLT